MSIHNLYSVYLNDASPITLPGIVTQNVRTGTEVGSETSSGAVYPDHLAVNRQRPGADFSSVCLPTCLAAIGLTGLNIGGLTTGLELFAFKHADGGGRASGSVHRKYSVKQGIVIPRRITCEDGGDAQVFYEVIPTWNGSVDPIVIADTSAAVAAVQATERHTIGKATIAGLTLASIRSWELDFGIEAVAEAADSDIFPKQVTIMECRPVLTLKGVDIEWMKSTNIPLAGKSGTHANTIVYLRKRLQTAAGFVADGTAEHCKFTLAGLAWVDEVFSKGAKGAAECTVKLAAKYDGTNAPVIIATASAIT